MKFLRVLLLIVICPMLLGFDLPIPPCGTFTLRSTPAAGGNPTIVTLDFKIDSTKCTPECTCNAIAFIQAIRVVKPDGMFYHAEDEHLNRMVQGSEKWLNGWAIDRIPRAKWGYYGLDSINPAGQLVVNPLNLSFGTNAIIATLTDRPGAGLPPGSSGQVVDVAVCVDKTQTCSNCLLGYYQWTFGVDGDEHAIDVRGDSAIEWHRDAVDHAIIEWNKESMKLNKEPFPEFSRLEKKRR